MPPKPTQSSSFRRHSASVIGLARLPLASSTCAVKVPFSQWATTRVGPTFAPPDALDLGIDDGLDLGGDAQHVGAGQRLLREVDEPGMAVHQRAGDGVADAELRLDDGLGRLPDLERRADRLEGLVVGQRLDALDLAPVEARLLAQLQRRIDGGVVEAAARIGLVGRGSTKWKRVPRPSRSTSLSSAGLEIDAAEAVVALEGLLRAADAEAGQSRPRSSPHGQQSPAASAWSAPHRASPDGAGRLGEGDPEGVRPSPQPRGSGCRAAAAVAAKYPKSEL